MKVGGILGLMAWASCAWLAAQDYETITNKDGKSIEVEILSVAEGKVSLKNKQGKEFTLALEMLDKKDQARLKSWKPKVIPPAVSASKIRPTGKDEASFFYASKNFAFETEKEVAKSDLEELSLGLEATLLAFAKLPIKVEPKAKEPLYKIKLFESAVNFELDNARELLEGETCVYNQPLDTLMAPTLRLQPSPPTITEACYLMLGEQVEQIPPWLTVAIAEYLASAPLKDGERQFTNPLEALKKHAADVLGIKGPDYSVLPPASVLDLIYGDFRQGEQAERATKRFSAVLLMYFVAYVDQGGSGQALKDYYLNVRTGSKEEALKGLLNKRSPAKWQDDMKVGMLGKAVQLSFK